MRALRTAIVAVMLMVALASCEMTVRFTTTLDAGGGGTFALGVALDREARDQIGLFADRFGQRGFASIEELFEGLEEAGWTVERTQPDGGVAYEARRVFTDADDFGRVLGELRSARETDDAGLAEGLITLDVDAERSFLRSRTVVSGSIDTSVAEPTEEEVAIIELVRRVLRIEVRAELPGSVGEVSGEPSIGEGVVIWRPRYGEALTFAATSSSLRVGSLLLVLVPSLALLAALGWFALGRRQRHAAAGGGAIEWESAAPHPVNGAAHEPDGLARALRAEHEPSELPADAGRARGVTEPSAGESPGPGERSSPDGS